MYPEFTKEEPKNEGGNTNISSLAIKTFIALVGLIIVLVTSNYANDILVKIVLIIAIFIFIVGFYGHGMHRIFKNYLKNRKYNKLANIHFKSFRKLVIIFKEFTEGRDDNIHLVMHNIKNQSSNLEGYSNPFSQINVIWPAFFQERYKYYNERLNQFDGTKDSLVSFAEEFENILDMYDKLYINDPVNSIRNIGRNKVPLQYKESYNKARLKYIDFLNNYKKFAKIANEDLREKKNDDGFLGAYIIFRDYFDFPEEL